MHIGAIASALKELSEKAFNAQTFFFDLMEAFGAPVSTVKRLRDGSSGKSDVEDAFIWKSRAHFITRPGADIQGMLDEVAASKKTGSQKIQFLIATDGEMIGVRNLKNGASEFIKIADLGFNYDILLPLGG